MLPMGTAASSALRDENAANGPAYGSLEGLGGPRKLKKKPVLVLDPEELEQAHAMFHEASAELLGEDVERAPKPATILGLAPMEEDDPEEMGASDEVEDEDDTDLPSAEAVLSLTRRKTAPILDQSNLGLGPIEMSDEMNDGGFGDDAYADPSGPLDDSLDLENRIFPTLPIQPELAEEEEADTAPDESLAEPIAPAPSVDEEPYSEPEEPREAAPPLPQAEIPAPQKPVSQIPPAAEPAAPPIAAALNNAPSKPNQPAKAPLDPLAAVQARLAARTEQAKPEQPVEKVETPSPVRPTYEELRERYKKKWYELDKDKVEAREINAWSDESWAKEDWSDDGLGDSPAGEDAPDDAFGDEASGAVETGTGNAEGPSLSNSIPVRRAPRFVEDAFVPDAPAPTPAPTPAQPVAEPQPEPPPEPQASTPERVETEDHPAPQPVETPEALADDANYTLTGDDDDSIDGYAFMRDQRSRRAAITSTPKGQQSALRAKLLREAELEAEENARRAAAGDSLVLRFWNWLRGLFS